MVSHVRHSYVIIIHSTLALDTLRQHVGVGTCIPLSGAVIYSAAAHRVVAHVRAIVLSVFLALPYISYVYHIRRIEIA
jgi:hypothetical protein